MEGDPAGRGAKRLLVLGAGPAQLGLLSAAKEQGVYVIAVDRDASAPGFRLAERRAIISAEDEAGIDRLAAAERVHGIIAPGIDFPIAIAARVAERNALPHPISPQTAVLATSKLRQRERFEAAGVPYARHAVCASLEDAVAAAERFGYPCVVKAPDRQGQKGLALVPNAAVLADAFARARAAARSSLVLVEELVGGRELTVNAFSVGGRFSPLTVTDRIVAAPPAFGVALAHLWPSELAPGAVGRAVDVARAAAEAIGLTDGPSYTQVLVGRDGVARVGELAARLGGGHDAELCRAALGVDLNRLALSAAFGEPVEDERLRPEVQDGGACVRFLVAPPGVLKAVDGRAEAEAADGVVWVRLYRDPGYIFTPLRRGGDRAGAILAVGSSRDAAAARASAAAERIRFVTADAEALVET